jgi:hypothetical protein
VSATNSVNKRNLFRHTAAIVTDLAVPTGAAVVLSADREHKIRVSSLPFGKPVLSYCLGHTEYVRCVDALRPPNQGFAVSGGGDGFVRLWSIMDGALLASLQLCTPAADGAAPTDMMESVFSLVEDAAAPGRFAALLTSSCKVTLLTVRLPGAHGPASIAIEAVSPFPAQPMCATFVCGLLVVGLASGVFTTVFGEEKIDATWIAPLNELIPTVMAGACIQPYDLHEDVLYDHGFFVCVLVQRLAARWARCP